MLIWLIKIRKTIEVIKKSWNYGLRKVIIFVFKWDKLSGLASILKEIKVY